MPRRLVCSADMKKPATSFNVAGLSSKPAASYSPTQFRASETARPLAAGQPFAVLGAQRRSVARLNATTTRLLSRHEKARYVVQRSGLFIKTGSVLLSHTVSRQRSRTAIGRRPAFRRARRAAPVSRTPQCHDVSFAQQT